VKKVEHDNQIECVKGETMISSVSSLHKIKSMESFFMEYKYTY